MRFPLPTGYRIRRAFSLVEVVLAVGIVSFALVAIIALIGSALASARESLAQHEALDARRAVSEYLVQKAGFSEMYAAVKAAQPPVLFAFKYPANPTTGEPDAAMPPLMAVLTAGDPQLAARSSARIGRLFRVQFTLSPTYEIETASGFVARPSPANLPSSPDDYLHSALGLTATIHQVPDTTHVPAAGQRPVLRYDTVLRR